MLRLRDPKETLRRRLAVQLWAEGLSNPDLRREALFGVEQAVRAMSRMIREAQKEGRWPGHLSRCIGRAGPDRHPAGVFAAIGLGRQNSMWRVLRQPCAS